MIKRIMGKFLMKVAYLIVRLAPVSFFGRGVEEMPESMKKLR